MTKKGKFSLKLFSVSAIAAFTMAIPSSGVSKVSAAMLSGKGQYSSDFTSISEAAKAAAQLSESIAEEGITLLKNKDDNALPVKGDLRVSVFGVCADNMTGTSQKLSEVMAEEGFAVNQSLADYYGKKGGSIGNELTEKDFTQQVVGSVNLYSDMGVVVLSRAGGEGDDLKMVTTEKEDNKYGNEDQGWKHKDLYKDADGNEYKHYLELTDSEEQLLEFVKKSCKKVVVVVETSNVLEMSNLQNDEDIDGIMWIGRLGEAGLNAVPRILNGSVNPSGRTTDLWAKDHTADTTWINYGTGQQQDGIPEVNGKNMYVEQDSSGDKNRFYYPEYNEDGSIKEYVEYVREQHGNVYREGPDMFEGYSFTYYEEGIYAGYRYYETADAEAKAGNYAGFNYNDAVVYPFGYGLSYTNFSWKNVTPASNVANWAEKDQITLKVEVTNTGSVAGKDVVQVYAHAPYIKGEVEKAESVLAGFAKTDLLQPGKSQVVEITVDVQDIASFDDYDKNHNGHKTYELDAGSGYELRFQTDSHNVKVTQALSDLAQDVFKDVDPYSGNEIKALLSETDNNSYNDEFNSLGYDPKTQKNLEEEGKFTSLTRSDFVGTFPKDHTMDEISRSQDWFKWQMGRDLYTADETISLSQNNDDIAAVADFGYKEDESDSATNQKPWVQKASDWAEGGKYANWTQGENKGIKYSEMAGIDMNDTVNKIKSDNKELDGLTGAQAWEKFMNQLTYQEMVITVSNITEKKLDSVGAPRTPANDSPKNLGSSFDWGDECHIAATFNTELAKQEGIIVGSISLLQNSGWYGPAMDGHRSPFGGRNNEYYAEDGYLAGMIGASVVSGAQSKGCACYIKHFALNEQETGRVHSSAIITEQAAREVYFKQFKISIQKGNAQWIMCSMGSVGDIQFGVNYNVMTEMVKKEWGYTGMVATDAWKPQKDCWPIDLMVRMGLDAALQDADETGAGSSSNATYLVSGSWDATKRGGKGAVMLNAYAADGTTVEQKESYTQWYSVRNCATRILFTNVNSNYIRNGIDVSSYTGNETLAEASQGVAYNASAAANIKAETVTYTLSGDLPAGLSFNSSTGAISGTPSKVGTFNFTVNLVAENYITASKSFSISVKSAFTTDADMTQLKVGEAVSSYIESDLVKLSAAEGDGGYDTIEYNVVEGQLPEGLTIVDGEITGTPTKAGTYKATIEVAATKTVESQGSGSGSGGGTTTSKETTKYNYELTFVVAEGAPLGYEENVPYVGDNGNWFVNGKDTGVKAAGTNGKDGKDGVDGKDGQDAKGCGGSATAATGLGLLGLVGALFLRRRKNSK